MNLEKKIIALEKRVKKLEAHQHPVPKRPKPKAHQKEDALLRRERLEERPLFTDNELWNHNVLHKQDKLPYHKHKESTMRQFRDFTRRGVAKKEKEDKKRVAADRVALIKQATEDLRFRKALKTNTVRDMAVKFHGRTPRGPYAWLSWSPPAKSRFKILGYYVEENGSAYPMIPPNRKKFLLRDWAKGAKVRIAVVYEKQKGQDEESWSSYLYCK